MQYKWQGRNIQVNLFIQETEKCYVQNFLGKTLNLVVLDSGCLNKYVEKNGWNVMLKVHVMMIERKYKNWTQTQTLGLGIEKSELLRSVSILSIFCAILLVEMWHMEQNDVVNSEITLLLSKESKRLQILQSFVRAKSKKKNTYIVQNWFCKW